MQLKNTQSCLTRPNCHNRNDYEDGVRMNEVHYLTAEGAERLKNELEYLKGPARDQLAHQPLAEPAALEVGAHDDAELGLDVVRVGERARDAQRFLRRRAAARNGGATTPAGIARLAPGSAQITGLVASTWQNRRLPSGWKAGPTATRRSNGRRSPRTMPRRVSKRLVRRNMRRRAIHSLASGRAR